MWNKNAATLSGYSSADTMGHNLVNEFITEDFRASVQEVLDKALQGEEAANFAFPLVTKGGTRLEILLNATSRRDVDGHIIGVVGIGQDITARLAQEQEYSKLIDTANAPIFGVDEAGRVTVYSYYRIPHCQLNSRDPLHFHANNRFGINVQQGFRATRVKIPWVITLLTSLSLKIFERRCRKSSTRLFKGRKIRTLRFPS